LVPRLQRWTRHVSSHRFMRLARLCKSRADDRSEAGGIRISIDDDWFSDYHLYSSHGRGRVLVPCVLVQSHGLNESHQRIPPSLSHSLLWGERSRNRRRLALTETRTIASVTKSGQSDQTRSISLSLPQVPLPHEVTRGRSVIS